jgi:hypothetical protein
MLVISMIVLASPFGTALPIFQAIADLRLPAGI